MQPPLPVSVTVNGQPFEGVAPPRMLLSDFLRETVGLTGVRVSCEHGICGACTIILDGEPVRSCLMFAAQADGTTIRTVEGLADGDTLHPMQQAFIDHDAFQCGYCTPGQIMSAVACVHEGHAQDDAQIREYMSGNLCRCAAYPHIVEAIQQAKPDIERS